MSQDIKLFAQANEAYCQNIYVWDVFQDKDKKSTDPFIIADIESAILSNKGTTVLNRRNAETIPVKIKNEKANQLTDKISDALAKKLNDVGVKNILFTTITEASGGNTVLNFKIYALQSRSIVLSKTLSIPQAVFSNNRDKRKVLLADFFKKEVLGLESSLKNALVWSGVGVGTAVTAFGVYKSVRIKSDWKNYLAKNPSDSENNYLSKNKNYKTHQYMAFGGALVLATSAYLVQQKRQKQKQQKQAFLSDNTPLKPRFIIEPLSNSTGIGLTIRF